VLVKNRIHRIAALFQAIAAAAVLAIALPGIQARAAHSLPDTSFTQVPGSDIWTSPQVSAQEAYNDTVYWLLTPQNVRDRLLNDNVRIYLISKKDETLTAGILASIGDSRIGVGGLTTHPVYNRYIYQSTGALAYVTRKSDGMIEIQTDLPGTTVADSLRLLHEIGHYCDSAAGGATGTLLAISSTPEWKNYYNTYASQILRTSTYSAVPNLYSASECWADAFKLAYAAPASLQAISPDLYNYVTAQVAAIPSVGPGTER
jgi:hypothetical protein